MTTPNHLRNLADQGRAMGHELHARMAPMHGAAMSPPERNALRDLRMARELLHRWERSQWKDFITDPPSDILRETREFLEGK